MELGWAGSLIGPRKRNARDENDTWTPYVYIVYSFYLVAIDSSWDRSWKSESFGFFFIGFQL
jgi:hypothetical protein